MLAILPTSLRLSPVPWPVYPGSSFLANVPATKPAAGIKKLGLDKILPSPDPIVPSFDNGLSVPKIPLSPVLALSHHPVVGNPGILFNPYPNAAAPASFPTGL